MSVVFGFGAVYLINFCFLQCFPHLESERKIGCFEAGSCRSLPPVTYAHLSEFNNIITIFYTLTRKVIKSYTKVPHPQIHLLKEVYPGITITVEALQAKTNTTCEGKIVHLLKMEELSLKFSV